MKKTSLNEQMVWDGEKGVVIVLQTPTQLQGPVFESGDWSSSLINFVLNLSKLFLVNRRMSSS